MFLRSEIEERSTPVPEAGCHLWLGSPGANGYGQIKKNQVVYSAHRASYEAFIGPVPSGAVVMHKCDTPLCVNPLHLAVGTQAQNMRDRDAKGRARTRNIPRETILAIRSFPGTHREIGQKFRVSVGWVSAIKNKKCYGDIQ
ncbi:HNH endonuclease signature motif containing protein [Xanthomonas sp. NCPPB 1325]|uniref:HNH endonuclease signature motif containing protein n=1 Tax=Xanthomonas sp. NCPPB 1325 TaxID=487529 RepID=UPI00355858AC